MQKLLLINYLRRSPMPNPHTPSSPGPSHIRHPLAVNLVRSSGASSHHYLTGSLTVFIYSCPSSSPIKHRMLYSSGSGSTLRWIKELLASTAPTAQLASRKIETSEPRELTEEYIVEELRLNAPQEAEGNEGATSRPNDAPKPFAKPRGPPRRR